MSLGLSVDLLRRLALRYNLPLFATASEEELLILYQHPPRCFEQALPTTFDKENLTAVSQAAEKLFYAPNLMLFLSCLITSMVRTEKIANLHNWLEREKLEGAIEDTYAFLTSLGNIKRDLYIESSPHAITHEVFVGMMGTNSLRGEIPNFVYIYGGFNCAPPVVFEGKLYDFCWKEEERGDPQKDLLPYNYLVEERIKGYTLHDNIPYASSLDFLNWYLQVLFSLNIAYKRLGFTHFSLDTQAVVIREIPQAMKFAYSLGEGLVYYITTSTISTIVNLQTASIFYNNEAYTNLSPELTSRLAQTTNYPLYDAYSLLRDSYYRALETGNEQIRALCLDLVGYFTRDNPLYFIENVYYLPPQRELVLVTLKGFIEFILSAKPSFVTKDSSNVVNCETRPCPLLENIMERYNFETFKPPLTIDSFYVDYKTLPLKTQENYHDQINLFMKELEREAHELDKSIVSISSPERTIEVTKDYRELKRKIKELKKYAKEVEDVDLEEELKELKEKHERNWQVLAEKDRVFSARVSYLYNTKPNPMEYAQKRNLLSYLDV